MKRFWEIDALRGVAIILMVLYHFVFDLQYFFGIPINIYSGPWKYVQLASASLFLFLVGVSLVLSYQRRAPNNQFAYYLKRGLTIFSWGLAITLVTYLFLGKSAVLFGILHLIGLSIIIAYPFVQCTWRAIFVAAVLFIVQAKVAASQNAWFFWFGTHLQGWTSVDYYPVVPWFAITLLGIAAGNFLFSKQKRTYGIVDWTTKPVSKYLQWLGRHSLIIYLVHQPIILGVLYLLRILTNT